MDLRYKKKITADPARNIENNCKNSKINERVPHPQMEVGKKKVNSMNEGRWCTKWNPQRATAGREKNPTPPRPCTAHRSTHVVRHERKRVGEKKHSMESSFLKFSKRHRIIRTDELWWEVRTRRRPRRPPPPRPPRRPPRNRCRCIHHRHLRPTQRRPRPRHSHHSHQEL